MAEFYSARGWEIPPLPWTNLSPPFSTKGYFVSEASVYRLLKAHDLITSPAFVVVKAADEFHDKTTAPNQLWQTDFTYFKVIGWGWFYLSTILDDYSRYIIAWKLCTTMRTDDVTETLNLALKASGCDRAKVVHKPRLLSDNGSSYISGDLAEWLEDQKIDHVRGAPYHPQTQGKVERWHQTLKNRILLENYFLPGDLERQIGAFVDHYNNHRYHESIGNVTPADAYFGRDTAIIERRQKIKNLTIQIRRVAPWDWRAGERLQSARQDTGGDTGRNTGGCSIKGNISRDRTRIYHVPGGLYYERTRISPSKGERWFCSEAEARSAGWRRSRR